MKSKVATKSVFIFAAIIFFSSGAFCGETTDQKSESSVEKKEPTPLDLLTVEETYTGASTVRGDMPSQKQDAFHTSFDYSHRFLITGNWYLRLGVAYERYDFTPSISPLPDHLQSASATIACEYVVQGFAGAAIELHPGFYFENDINGRNFSVPIDAYAGFKIINDKLFGMIGFFEGQFFKPSVIPIVGVIWVVNDKTRLEALFPRSAFVYAPTDNWEFRATGSADGYGFRMDDNGRTPATYRGAVMEYYDFQAGAQATYSGWKPLGITLGAGYDFQREFYFFRYNYNDKYKAAGAPYVKLGFEVKF